MNRRDALKGMGLSVGYAIAAPSVLSLLHSCKTEASVWTPTFFTQEEATVITNLVDLILPTTKSSPGALDVNVPEFLDIYVAKYYDLERQTTFRNGIKAVTKALGVIEGDTSILKAKDYDVLLAKYLKSTKEQQKVFKDSANKEQKDSIIYKALTDLRRSAVWAYKTSEEIGENVMAYDPVPGMQQGCVSLNETTGGKAWSL
jgi:hypothetical protein